MDDLVYVMLIIGFFGVASVLIRLCDRIIGPDELSEPMVRAAIGEVAA